VSSTAILFNFIWALLLVLALAYVAIRLMGRVGILRKSPARFLEQVDYLPLGPKRGIALIQVVDRTLAVGVSEAGIHLLTEVDPEALKSMAKPGAPPAFYEELLSRLRRDRAE
jgi:flagellar protein FliO/FliZ